MATTPLASTIETMIECAIGKDATNSQTFQQPRHQTLQSSSSVHCIIGADLFKSPTALLDLTMKCAINGAFAISSTSLSTPTILTIDGSEQN